MTITGRDVWVASLAYLKSRTEVTSLLSSTGDIKERQWQGDDFIYPAVRISIVMYPDKSRCAPDRAELYIKSYSEEKSSNECQQITAAIHSLLHGSAFLSSGIRFTSVLVTKSDRPQRTVLSWEQELTISCLVSAVP